MGVVQYLVTAFGGLRITEVDAAITGLASAAETGEMNKNLCEGAQFGGGAVRTALYWTRKGCSRPSVGVD
jgi:hypothetical protein